MDKTLEELRAETDRYINSITALCEKINYDIRCINKALREAQEVLTEEQLIESKPEKVEGVEIK